MARRLIMALAATAMLCVAFAGDAADPHKQSLAGYVVPEGPVTGPVPETTVVHLAIGLPPRDPAGLRALADAVADPRSHEFHHFLTLDQVVEKFGPSAADYAALRAWATQTS